MGAGFASRVLAWIIDLAGLRILFLVASEEVFVGAFQLLSGSDVLSSQTDSVGVGLLRQLAVGGVIGLVAIGAMSASLRILGATPGQRLVGLLTLDSEGRDLEWSQAVGRSLMLYGPFVAMLIVPAQFAAFIPSFMPDEDMAWAHLVPWVVRAGAIAWYLFLFTTTRNDEDGRGFHDLASRSIVVQVTAKSTADDG
jgi:uncharacterized RDD family membrane protein YckC